MLLALAILGASHVDFSATVNAGGAVTLTATESNAGDLFAVDVEIVRHGEGSYHLTDRYFFHRGERPMFAVLPHGLEIYEARPTMIAGR